MNPADQLQQLVRGLLYTSESDYPFAVIVASLEAYPWPLSDDSVRGLVKGHHRDAVRKVELTEWLDISDDNDADGKLGEIVAILQEFPERASYRVGGVHCRYLAIVVDGHRLIGLSTEAVET